MEDDRVYKVTFSHSVWVRAANEDDAEELGYEEYVMNLPSPSDMGALVEEETNQDWIEELDI